MASRPVTFVAGVLVGAALTSLLTPDWPRGLDPAAYQSMIGAKLQVATTLGFDATDELRAMWWPVIAQPPLGHPMKAAADRATTVRSAGLCAGARSDWETKDGTAIDPRGAGRRGLFTRSAGAVDIAGTWNACAAAARHATTRRTASNCILIAI